MFLFQMGWLGDAKASGIRRDVGLFQWITMQAAAGHH